MAKPISIKNIYSKVVHKHKLHPVHFGGTTSDEADIELRNAIKTQLLKAYGVVDIKASHFDTNHLGLAGALEQHGNTGLQVAVLEAKKIHATINASILEAFKDAEIEPAADFQAKANTPQ